MSDSRKIDDTLAASEPPAGTDSHVRPRSSNAPAPEPNDLVPGTIVGEYEIDQLIGRGGMGSVYSARQPLIGKRVAIKVLSTDVPSDATLVRRFVDEARAVNKIGHPNIIDIFSFGQLPDARQYFVMELLQGYTLRDRIEAHALDPAECARYLEQICSALSAAHSEQIVHRDLKPENIWISTPKHGEPYVKLLDFGIAKLIETQPVGPATQTGVAMGTPQFMSPEQCRGKDVDHRTDIYALGIILYEIFAGRLPFTGGSFIEVLMQHMSAKPAAPSDFRAVPPAIEQLILSCLEKDPNDRPQSAAAVLLAFREATLDKPSQPGSAPGTAKRRRSPESELETIVTDPNAGRTLRLVTLGMVCLALVAAVVWYTRRSQAPEPVQPPAAKTVAAPSVEPAQPPPATPVPVAEPPQEAAPAVTPPPVEPPKVEAPPVRASEPPRTQPVKRGPRQSTRVEKQGLVTDNPFQ